MDALRNLPALNELSARPPKTAEKFMRFGAFEFRTDIYELRKHGVRMKVQTKPLAILHALIENPGELVTREDLCRRLWPDGTFVDFESGLNTATNRLRVALGDSAEQPRYIETLPRRGYRFICPVVKPSEVAKLHLVATNEKKDEFETQLGKPSIGRTWKGLALKIFARLKKPANNVG